MTSASEQAKPSPLLQAMRSRGQSVWMRGLRRQLVESGRLEELMSAAALSGLTSDLTVLAGAVSRGAEYAEIIRQASDGDNVGTAILLAQEAGIAASPLRSLYQRSDGRDGIAMVTVDPSLASDAEAMARAARDMLRAVDAANVMVELPPTDAGFAVFETLVADGLQVSIGPVFSVSSVQRATDAYLGAADDGSDARAPTALVTFGVASIDGLVDQLLRREIRAGGRDMSEVESLLGGAGVAIAKVAWRAQRDLLTTYGAQAASGLRLAWTDLSSADPRQTRVHYVERLVGPDTVAVLDAALLGSVMRGGEAGAALGERIDEAEELVAELADLGIDVMQVGAALEAKGLRQAKARYAHFRQIIAAAAEALADDGEGATRRVTRGTRWWAGAPEIDDELAPCDELVRRRALARLWEKDASLWGDDEEAMELVRNRLGWLDLTATLAAAEEPLIGFAAELEAAEIENVVLLGMGGSSLAAETCRDVFGSDRLLVLDSTVPEQIQAVADRVDPARTSIVVASKSGSTIEVRALFDWFYALATPMLDNPGERFAAITDPGTPLEQIAHERRFDRLWLAPSDVGGRFSALTVFGTLPMALMGIDFAAVLAAARRMAACCQPEVDATANPAARLAAALHHAWRNGRDKLTLVTAPSIAAFAPWVEQLVAESTGKQGRGLVPVVDEPVVSVDDYADDRLFVALSVSGEEDADHLRRVEEIDIAGHPLLRFELDDRHDLGGEFFRWEAAVALLGALMGLNPFDQPDVQSSKDRTDELLTIHREGGAMSDQAPLDGDTGWAVFADLERDDELRRRHGGEGLAGWLAAHLGRVEPPDYVAIQAFLPSTAEVLIALQSARRLLTERLGVATTLGWGPRFLHSTGQLHKGGPDSGVFLQLTADARGDIGVPGAGFTFGELLRAQSLGDLQALYDRDRRVLRVHFRAPDAGCAELLAALDEAIG